MPELPTKKLSDEWIAWATKHRDADIKLSESKPFTGARIDAAKEKEAIGPEPTRHKED